MVLRNRGAGPFGLLNLLDERCGGVFDDIDAVIPPAERDEFMSRYKAAAGFAKDKLNGAPRSSRPGHGSAVHDAMLEHYVFLKYREGTSATHVATFCERMLAFSTRSTRFAVSRSVATNCTMPAAGTWC